MLVIPAIDLKDGKCVRLKQGRMDDDTVYSEDPVEMARYWVSEGARRLHLVDLNGAFEGTPVNGEVVKAIVAACPEIPVQVGGGIRDEDPFSWRMVVITTFQRSGQGDCMPAARCQAGEPDEYPIRNSPPARCQSEDWRSMASVSSRRR